MAIHLTKQAANRVKQFLASRGTGVGLRFGVTKTGCSGMAYVVEFADAIEAEDYIYESNGVKVIVDIKSLPFVDGTQIDFGQDGLNECFRFLNPNVKSECGCGESFGV